MAHDISNMTGSICGKLVSFSVSSQFTPDELQAMAIKHKAPKEADRYTPIGIRHTLWDRSGQPWTHFDFARLQDFVAKRNELLKNIAEAKANAEKHTGKAKQAEFDERDMERTASKARLVASQEWAGANVCRQRQAVLENELEALGGAS